MEKDELSIKSFAEIYTIELISLTSLVLPAVLVGLADKRGMFVLVASSVVFLLQGMMTWLFVKKQGKSPDEILQKRKGFWTKICQELYILRYFLHGLFLTVVFVDLIKTVLLPECTETEILIPFLLLVAYTGSKKFSVRRRMMRVLFPCIFLPLFCVLLLSLFQLDYSFLPQQLWGEGRSLWGKDLIYGIYGVLVLYQPVEFILFLFPKIKSNKKRDVGKYVFAVCIVVILLNITIYVAAVGLLGTVRVGRELWSALYIMQSVRLPGHFLERLDILFIPFWIFSTFTSVSSYYYYGSLFLSEKKEDVRHGKGKIVIYAAVWTVVGLFLALWINKPQRMFELFMPYKMWIDFPLSLLLLFFIYCRKD